MRFKVHFKSHLLHDGPNLMINRLIPGGGKWVKVTWNKMNNTKNPYDFLRLYCSQGENPEPRLWSKRKLAWASFSPHLPLTLRLQITNTCHSDLPLLLPHQWCSSPPVLWWLFPVSVPSLICSTDHFQFLSSTFSLWHWWPPHFLAPDSLNAAKFSLGDAAFSASFKSLDSKLFVPSKGSSLLWTLYLLLEGQFSGPTEPESGKFQNGIS